MNCLDVKGVGVRGEEDKKERTQDLHKNDSCLRTEIHGTSLVVQGLRTCDSTSEPWVQSLAGEVRSCLPHSMAEETEMIYNLSSAGNNSYITRIMNTHNRFLKQDNHFRKLGRKYKRPKGLIIYEDFPFLIRS